MADGGITIGLNSELGERLKAAAGVSGRSADDYAAELIAKGLDAGWDESFARYAEYERTGEYLDAEVLMEEFRQSVRDRLRARKG